MKLLLLPISFIYYLIISLRNHFYDSGVFKMHKLGAKVISVGNITWGGTGKTPTVLLIAETLMREGHKVTILIRGYGNDEQVLLSKLAGTVPVVAGKDRVRSGKEAIARYSVDTVLLDDGFQHKRLRRDLDIVCIDATDPFGNGCLIPAGSMREGLGGLKRSGIFLITKSDLAQDKKALQDLEEKLKRINPGALIVKSVHKAQYLYKLSDEQLIDIETLKNKNIALVSAIGNPRSFEKTISNLGLRFKRHFIFRDHHRYGEKDLERIEDYYIKNEIDTIVTTEKDAIKLKAYSLRLTAYGFLVLHIELKIIENEQGFCNRLFRIYNS